MMTAQEILDREEKMKESLLEIERSNLSDEQKAKAGELLINYPQVSVEIALKFAREFKDYSVEYIGTYWSHYINIFSAAFENSGDDLEKWLEAEVYDLSYRSGLGLKRNTILGVFDSVLDTALKIKRGETVPKTEVTRRKAEAICNHLELYSADHIQDLIDRICPNIDDYNNITLDAYRKQLSSEVRDYFKYDFALCNPTDYELVRHAYEVYVEYLEILDKEDFCSMVGIERFELDSVLSTDDNSVDVITDEDIIRLRNQNFSEHEQGLIDAIFADLKSGQCEHYNYVLDNYCFDPDDLKFIQNDGDVIDEYPRYPSNPYRNIDWYHHDVKILRLVIAVYGDILGYKFNDEIAYELGFVDDNDDGDFKSLCECLNEKENVWVLRGSECTR